MIRDLIREVIKNQSIENILLEDFQQVVKIKDTYYPDLKNVKKADLVKIDSWLSDQNVLKTTYLNWIFLLIRNRVPRVMEDMENIAKSLKIFSDNSKKIAADGYPTMLYKKNGDLVYKNQQELYELVSKYGKIQKGVESKLVDKGNYLVSKGMAEKIYEDSNYAVFSPLTYDASKELACLSKWCTRFPDMYKHYSSQGPLYIILDKKKLDTDDRFRMIQFHIPSRQFKDVLDKEVPNRKEYMNRLKGFFKTLFPDSLREYKMVSDGIMDIKDISQATRDSKFIMPSEYWGEFDIPCDEFQIKIAYELGVNCKEVDESEQGRYVVDDEIYEVNTVESEREAAVDNVLNSGYDDDWFMSYILPSYNWDDVYKEDSTNIAQAVENEFGDDRKDVYENYFKDILEKEYTEEEIENGDYIEDIDYIDFLTALENTHGSDPMDWYINQMGMKLSDLNFIDLEKEVRNYLMSYENLGHSISTYDGNFYFFNIGDNEYVLYRVE